MKLLEMFPALSEADMTDQEIMQRMQSIRQRSRSAINLIQAILQDPKVPWDQRNKLADAVSILEEIGIESDLGRPRTFK